MNVKAAVEQALDAATVGAELECMRARVRALTNVGFPRFAGLLDVVRQHRAVVADESLADAIDLVSESFVTLWDATEVATSAQAA